MIATTGNIDVIRNGNYPNDAGDLYSSGVVTLVVKQPRIVKNRATVLVQSSIDGGVTWTDLFAVPKRDHPRWVVRHFYIRETAMRIRVQISGFVEQFQMVLENR